MFIWCGVIIWFGVAACKLKPLHANQPFEVPCKIKGALSSLKVPFHFLGKHKTNKHIDVSKCLRHMFDCSFGIVHVFADLFSVYVHLM